MIIESLGFVEVRGAANAIAVADAMLKASNVRILSESRLDPGQVTVIVEGDLGACQAAIEIGAEVARRSDCLIGVLLKGKPDPAIEALFQSRSETAPPVATSPRSSRPRRAAADTTHASLDDVFGFIAASESGTTIAEVARTFSVGVKTARRWVSELVEQEKVERFNRGIRVVPGADGVSGADDVLGTDETE